MNLNISNVYNKPYVISPGNNYKANKLKTIAFSGQELITPEVKEKMTAIDSKIQQSNNIAIFTHINPDEDAIGSSAALKELIETKYPDKKVHVFIEGRIPHGAKCIDGIDSFELIDKNSNLKAIKARNYDLAISVDCANRDLMKDGFDIFDSISNKIKIDHHPDTENINNYADINLVCPDASAAAQVVLLLADHMGVPLNKKLATPAYVAIVGDTAGFRYMAKPEDVFEDCSRLSKTGIDTRNIYCKAQDYMPKEALSFYADVLKNIKFAEGGKIAYLVDDSLAERDPKTGKYINTSKTLQKEGLEKADVKGILNNVLNIIMPNIEGVKIAVKINEQDDRIKGRMDTGASLRGNNTNVAKFAEEHGGGGHKFAAAFIGARENAAAIIQDLSEYLKAEEQQN